MKVKKIVAVEEDIDIISATVLSKNDYESHKDLIRKINNSWWLRSPGYTQSCADSVYSGGFCRSCDVDFTRGVRPSLIVNLKSSDLQIGDRFHFGNEIWTVISETLAICNSYIGECAFREDWTADDANNYEASDLKKYVDNWFKNVTNGCDAD